MNIRKKPFSHTSLNPQPELAFGTLEDAEPSKSGKENLLSSAEQPLAERMRPQRLEEVFGHADLIGPDSPLRRAIEEDRVRSFILWGPPGTGKTTIARIVAAHTQRQFIGLSAVMAGVKDIKESVAQAEYWISQGKPSPIVFVDEIHRFNKAQQDALLPYVEDGTLILIGATTENPSFELNSALLSRSPVYVLKPLAPDDLVSILTKALQDPTRGLGSGVKIFNSMPASVLEEWITDLAHRANGDARRALTMLERVFDFLRFHKNAPGNLSLESKTGKAFYEKALGHQIIRYDASGEEHYDTISAFIKSMRDSDPDGALYYLARMLEGGEEPLFIARRMVIFASEDIGNADPRALQVALAVKEAVDFVGMPEGRINLAHGVTYLASAPKSNASYMGIESALSDVRESGNLEIPLHIRNAPTSLMKNLGYGKNYKYAHSEDIGFSQMKNLPQLLEDKIYYDPKDSGLEKTIREKTLLLRSKRRSNKN